MATNRESRILQLVILGYWSLFWLLNVIDKFIGGSTYLFAGRDRASQLAKYFSSIGITNDLIPQGALVISTVLEIIALLYVSWAFVKLVSGDKHRAHHLFFRGTLAGLLIFGFFSIGDQVFGDRFELLEHTLYWIAVLVSWAAYSYFPRREAQ